jgi:hypothetical protein
VSESRIGEHQQLVERLQAEVSERYGVSGAPTAEVTLSNVREAKEQADYVVTISNPTDTSYIVVIGYLTSDSPEPQEPIAQELPAGKAVAFQLTSPGQCASLQAYMMVFLYEDETLAFWSPPDADTGGVWTPERISQEFPQDQDLCVDRWTL